MFIRNKKVLVTALAVTLILCGIIGSTVAWLIAETDPVINTFTYGDINIDINETPVNPDGTPVEGGDPVDENEYVIVPGHSYTKDPTVTVFADSEDSWVFVKLVESEDPAFDDFMEGYAIAEGWTALDGVDGVYYREYSKTDSDVEYPVIAGNTVTARGDLTKADLDALEAQGLFPSLTVYAYAVQRDSDIAAIDTAAEAWALVEANA